ncbi:hypothetical protein DFH11DRAFT_1863576 [Phellopilus nigrolimitatus]|nr:hypothetical protein DFH11DRAFT_1863576 [Phellopilus nigrolimitatus]
MKRKSLHRDISKSNVIINPKHNKHPEEKQNSDVGKYIEQVLDPTLEDVKEIVMLIDWDNAALLDDKSKGPVTDRAGTPMYIARAVSVGALKFSTFQTRAIFPEISEEAKALYIGAYDQEKYDYYIREINKLPLCIKPKERAPFEHLPYLDMESVFWLFAYLLCRARVGKEDDESNEDYDDFLRIMEQHDPGRAKDDSRDIFLAATELVKWKDRLHPKLQLVAEMLHEMAEYLNVQWAYWKGLIPEDHAHEMMKRLFLNTAVHVRKQGDVRIDLKRARQPLPNPGSVIPSPTSKKSRLNDGTAQGKASVRSKASIHNSREAFTVIQSGADVFGPIQSNDNVGFVDVPQAQSRFSVGEKRRREE